MSTLQKIMSTLMSWLLALLKLLIAIGLLAIAKITLRTNPDLAIAVLGTAAVMFLLWYFAPQIKQFFK
ncbi:MAG: hypothetical protein methR_P2303 [Methyloprofundus sp.]|nr:MAG: hypothetical protein methR_P2303 [Methyloprofundus sp.]